MKNTLQERFHILNFVTGFIVVNGKQSPQCDIIVCRKDFFRRELSERVFLVEPDDCNMIVEVKGNAVRNDLSQTLEKNIFFCTHPETHHIKLALFAYKTRIGKRQLYKEFGYQYDRQTKGYIPVGVPSEKARDYFICLHRVKLGSENRKKQVFFLKDGIEKRSYTLDNHYPVMQNFLRLIQSLQNDFEVRS